MITVPDIRLMVLTSLQQAGQSGTERGMVGISPEALKVLLDGKVMNSPIIPFEGYDDEGNLVMKIPMFCDPGLEGLSSYVIPWPAHTVPVEAEEKDPDVIDVEVIDDNEPIIPRR